MGTGPLSLEVLSPFRRLPRGQTARSGSAIAGQVHFDRGQVHFALLLEGNGIEDLIPVAGAAVFPVGVALGLALAVNAARGVRQCVEAGDRDPRLADLAQAVGPLFQASDGAWSKAQVYSHTR